MSENNVTYWVVGASWGGQDHADKHFVENSYWCLGWKEQDQPYQFKQGKNIKINDRIAIKRMMGQGATTIKILHIGIVKGVIVETNKVVCVVDWLATNLSRVVDSRGCFKSIHEFTEKDEWIEKVFCL